MVRHINVGRSLFLLSCIVGLNGYPLRTIAQETLNPLEPNSNLKQVPEFTPPDVGGPPTAIRFPDIHRYCPHAPLLDDLELQISLQSDPRPAHMTHRRPILAIQLPDAATTESVFFVLQDDGDNRLYETFVPMADQNNYFQVILPEAVPELELNHHYYGTFAIPCDGSRLRPDSPFIRICISQTEQGAILYGEERDRRGAVGSSGLYLDCPESVSL